MLLEAKAINIESEIELLEYEFYYISNTSVFGWDLIVYSIMAVSLVAMILSICRKSPIEIIKDL